MTRPRACGGAVDGMRLRRTGRCAHGPGATAHDTIGHCALRRTGRHEHFAAPSSPSHATSDAPREALGPAVRAGLSAAAPPPPGATLEIAPGVLLAAHAAAVRARPHQPVADRASATATRSSTRLRRRATRAQWERHFAHHARGRPLRAHRRTHYHPDHLGNAAWLAAHVGCAVCDDASEYLAAHALSTATCRLRRGRRARAVRRARHGRGRRRRRCARAAIATAPACRSCRSAIGA